MENACERAIEYDGISYTLIKSILDRELDGVAQTVCQFMTKLLHPPLLLSMKTSEGQPTITNLFFLFFKVNN